MNDDQLDDALQDLRAELSIEPSPEFAAKVRQQIDQAPARSFWNVWTWTTVAATCGIAVVAGALWMRSGGGVVAPRGATPAQTTEPSPAPSLAQSTTPVLTPTAPTPKSMTSATKPATLHAAATEHKLDVLVPPDQLNAIRQLMSAVRTGGVKTMPDSAPLIDPETGEIATPKPIEIPLITVEPLQGAVEGRSGGSERK
jgi:hypothetical protein